MTEFDIIFENTNGLHARPAGELAAKVKELSSTVTICKGGKSASAEQIFALMGLGVSGGDTVTVKVKGENAEADAAALKSFMIDKFSPSQK